MTLQPDQCSEAIRVTIYPTQADKDRLCEAFERLTAAERQLLTCALAGNHPPKLRLLRMPVLRALARADGLSRGRRT